MPAYKLTAPLKYRHLGVFLPTKPPEIQKPLPATALADLGGCMPFQEADSHRITGEYTHQAIFVMSYGADAKRNWKRETIDDWTFSPVSRTDTFHTPLATLDDIDRFRNRLEFTTAAGEKMIQPMRYAHGVVATRDRFFEFALDAMRYDRVVFFSREDAYLAWRSIDRVAIDAPLNDEILLVQYSEDPRPKLAEGVWNAHGWKTESIPYLELERRREQRAQARETTFAALGREQVFRFPGEHPHADLHAKICEGSFRTLSVSGVSAAKPCQDKAKVIAFE